MMQSENAHDMVALAAEAQRAHAALARTDPSEFNGFVLKDTETGESIKQARIHRIWHALANRYKRLMLWSHVEAGKTTQLAIGRALYELGKNPNLRVVIISNTAGQSEKTLLAIKKLIERDNDLRLVYPRLIPGDLWTNTKLIVERTIISRDPSVQAAGLHGNILGNRIDLLILDDILDQENTATARAREDVYKWYHGTLVGRLTRNSRVWCIGNAWHPEDFMHKVTDESEVWASYRFPVIDENGVIFWPDQWPQSRIDAKRLELAGDPGAFARTMMCKARDDSDARFKQAWIDLCSAQGVGLRFVTNLSDSSLADVLPRTSWYTQPELPRGFSTVTGVDLASQRHQAAGKVVLFTILIYPNGKKRPLFIESGRWSGQEIIDKAVDHHERFRSIVVVENNAAQEFMAQFISQKQVPVVPFTTGRNKANPEFGVESLAAELARGEWIIPCTETTPGHYSYHPELSMWLQDMLFYDPTSHTGDHLMASWFAREGDRSLKPKKVQTGSVDLMSR